MNSDCVLVIIDSSDIIVENLHKEVKAINKKNKHNQKTNTQVSKQVFAKIDSLKEKIYCTCKKYKFKVLVSTSEVSNQFEPLKDDLDLTLIILQDKNLLANDEFTEFLNKNLIKNIVFCGYDYDYKISICPIFTATSKNAENIKVLVDSSLYLELDHDIMEKIAEIDVTCIANISENSNNEENEVKFSKLESEIKLIIKSIEQDVKAQNKYTEYNKIYLITKLAELISLSLNVQINGFSNNQFDFYELYKILIEKRQCQSRLLKYQDVENQIESAYNDVLLWSLPKPRMIVTLGSSGIGKTSFCEEFHDFILNKSNISDNPFIYCIFITFNSYTSYTEYENSQIMKSEDCDLSFISRILVELFFQNGDKRTKFVNLLTTLVKLFKNVKLRTKTVLDSIINLMNVGRVDKQDSKILLIIDEMKNAADLTKNGNHFSYLNGISLSLIHI